MKFLVAAPEWSTARDRRDLKKFLLAQDDICGGMEVNEADRDKLIAMLETMFWDARFKNREQYKASRAKKKA